ncbi:hypothetical protein L2E82_08234 [Cichorium intybus]|uniref:Uncharacterized protein n=1 Tax=Cichorium intybus TaxID=13427 RepID=A0ACB9G5Z4_CICIN|nr:hypothetical protein L2E82_08234 [Cichorium intybus]
MAEKAIGGDVVEEKVNRAVAAANRAANAAKVAAVKAVQRRTDHQYDIDDPTLLMPVFISTRDDHNLLQCVEVWLAFVAETSGKHLLSFFLSFFLSLLIFILSPSLSLYFQYHHHTSLCLSFSWVADTKLRSHSQLYMESI